MRIISSSWRSLGNSQEIAENIYRRTNNKGRWFMDRLKFHSLIEKQDDLYSAICLELNVASMGETMEEASRNLREAVELYLEDVIEAGEEEEFIPRPAPLERVDKILNLPVFHTCQQIYHKGKISDKFQRFINKTGDESYRIRISQ